jgi:hypothetical protein
MLDELVLLVAKFSPFVIGAVLLIKCVLFYFHKSDSWRIYNFFFFDSDAIRNSGNQRSVSRKKLQNNLNILVVILLALYFLLRYLLKQ